MRIIFIGGVVLTLVGCAGYQFPAQRQAQMREQFMAEKSAIAACFSNISADPSLSQIKDKVFLGDVSNQDFTYLTISSKPTAADRPILLAWARKRAYCFGQEKDFLTRWSAQTPAQISALILSVEPTSQALLADLYNGEMTYAEFAKKRQDLSTNARTSMAQIQAALQQHNIDAAQHAQELALQYQQNQILQQEANQQRFNSIRSHTLNCMTYGNQTNCNGD